MNILIYHDLYYIKNNYNTCKLSTSGEADRGGGRRILMWRGRTGGGGG
ncbi:MAG: hypothetical protein QOE33_3643 [Acidobacteriota bacterium]|jgi:hypothetical protein|nr:hypothetical protein [Acidobacteriota bacterium]